MTNILNFLKQLLQSDAGSFGFVIGLLLLAFWLVFWVTKNITSIIKDHSTISKSIK